MEIKEIQHLIDVTFKEHFGYTPLTERMEDIEREFFELKRHRDVVNLEEEANDLLCSVIELFTEQKFDIEEGIKKTLLKIKGRAEQYKTLGRKTKVAIIGGAFNPIHKGHIQLAQFILKASGMFDEVWLMPAYHHMYNKEMASPEDRLMMCEIAAKVDARIKVFDYEIKHQLRGETYYFFKKLMEEHELTEKYQFAMVIGLDNANSFDKWVNYEDLERLAQFVVIPRKGVQRDLNVDWYLKKPHIFLNMETDIIEISSTEIRGLFHLNSSQADSELLKVLDKDVFNYIMKNNLYEN